MDFWKKVAKISKLLKISRILLNCQVSTAVPDDLTLRFGRNFRKFTTKNTIKLGIQLIIKLINIPKLRDIYEINFWKILSTNLFSPFYKTVLRYLFNFTIHLGLVWQCSGSFSWTSTNSEVFYNDCGAPILWRFTNMWRNNLAK